MSTAPPPAQTTLDRADRLRERLSPDFRDRLVESLYEEATRIAQRAVKSGHERKWDLDQRIDRMVTSPIFGPPV